MHTRLFKLSKLYLYADVALNNGNPARNYSNRDDAVHFKHEKTGMYMVHTMEASHAYRRPIPGQKEISAIAAKTEMGFWLAQEGMYIAVDLNKVAGTTRDEL